MDSKFIKNLLKISMKFEAEQNFELSDKIDNLIKTAQYAGQFDDSSYTEGMFGVQMTGSSPTAFGPYEGPGNDVPFVSELDPMTIMKLLHTKGKKPGQSAYLDELERVKTQEQKYRSSVTTTLRVLAVSLKNIASDPERRDKFFANELELTIKITMQKIKLGKIDPKTLDAALESFYRELETFNSKNPNDLIPIDDIKQLIEKYR